MAVKKGKYNVKTDENNVVQIAFETLSSQVEYDGTDFNLASSTDKTVNVIIKDYATAKSNLLAMQSSSSTSFDSTNYHFLKKAERTKLAGIATGAEVNKIASISINGTPLTISSKAVSIPFASATQHGVVKISGNNLGLTIDANGNLGLNLASESQAGIVQVYSANDFDNLQPSNLAPYGALSMAGAKNLYTNLNAKIASLQNIYEFGGSLEVTWTSSTTQAQINSALEAAYKTNTNTTTVPTRAAITVTDKGTSTTKGTWVWMKHSDSNWKQEFKIEVDLTNKADKANASFTGSTFSVASTGSTAGSLSIYNKNGDGVIEGIIAGNNSLAIHAGVDGTGSPNTNTEAATFTSNTITLKRNVTVSASHNLLLPKAATAATHAVNKGYVDGKVTELTTAINNKTEIRFGTEDVPDDLVVGQVYIQYQE